MNIYFHIPSTKMKPILNRLLISCILIFISAHSVHAQNALKSAYNILQLKEANIMDTSIQIELYKELAKYVRPEKKESMVQYFKKFNYKSNFLKKYLTDIFKSDEVMINGTAKKDNETTLDELKEISTNTLVTKFLSTNFSKSSGKSIKIEQLENLVYRDSSSLKQLDSNQRASLLDTLKKILAIENFNSLLVTNKKFEAKLKTLFASGVPTLNANNTFEINNISNMAKAAGLPSQSAVIDALAIFLVKRVKEESVIAFLEHLNANIDRLQPLPCLFPNTAKEMAAFQVGEAERFGAITQKAIAVDLVNMPDNIIHCNFCDSTNQVKAFQPYTSFFTELENGVDLITNISYYADVNNLSKDSAAIQFNSAMRLLHFINKYYSNIYESDTTKNPNVWIGPDWMDFENGNDTLLRLSLALVYEKEKQAFDSFIQKRYRCNTLDAFLSSNKFKEFKTNFRKTFFSLHRLESYWQSKRVPGNSQQSLVDMTVYKQKVSDVLKDIYEVMDYPSKDFPPNNPIYQLYTNAKAAIAKNELRDIIFQSQKLLDALSCYEFRWKGFQLPSIKWPSGRDFCKEDSISDKIYAKLKGDSAIKLNELNTMSRILSNAKTMSTLRNEWWCNHFTRKSEKGWFRRPLRKYHERIKESESCGDYASAMNRKLNVMGSLQLFIFRWHDWKLMYRLNKLNKIYKWQSNLQSQPSYACYVNGERQLGNRFAFGSSRRQVSQLLNFFTDVTKASESKQLSQIIEKYAEPPQSYRVKRYNHFSFDINAWPGVYAGYETQAGQSLFATRNTQLVSGITAPIGISISFAGRRMFTCKDGGKRPVYINRKGKLKALRGSSWSLNLMAIDIGAVVAYRFSKDADEGLPQEVTLAQVVAPGAFLAYGIKGLPLALQAGIQYAPQLRKFGVPETKLLDAYRISFGLVYDIPLLNITNTNRYNSRTKN